MMKENDCIWKVLIGCMFSVKRKNKIKEMAFLLRERTECAFRIKNDIYKRHSFLLLLFVCLFFGKEK